MGEKQVYENMFQEHRSIMLMIDAATGNIVNANEAAVKYYGYTLAIILESFFGAKERKWDKKLLATDISLDVLKKAKEGIYKQEAIKILPRVWQKNYFKSTIEGYYEVREAICL